jgi:hypothetical protein
VARAILDPAPRIETRRRVPVLVQQTHRVTRAEHAAFARWCSDWWWTSLAARGVPMLAHGRWQLGGHDDEYTSYFVYNDPAQWAAVHDANSPQAVGWQDSAPPSAARLLELDDCGSWHTPHIPGFGRGSVISGRTYALRGAAREEFARLSRQHVWPWLERVGARLVAFGHDPLGIAEEVVTLTAFRSLADWQRLSHPDASPDVPSNVVRAWNQHAALLTHSNGRLLVVDADSEQAPRA